MSSLKIANSVFSLGDYKNSINLYSAYAESSTNDFLIEQACFNKKIAVKKIEEKDNPIKVSVIVPCHNVEQYISKCLDSILNQTLKEIEIIAVDDGSTDATHKILLTYSILNKNIKIVRNSKPSGNSGMPRNQALRIAKGEYVAFVDSDDWIENNMLEELYSEGCKSQSDVISSNGFYRHTDDGSQERVSLSNYEYGRVNKRREELFLSQHFTIVWFRIYKRDFLKRNNIKFGTTKTSADLPFAFLSLLRANRVSSVGSSYYHYIFNRPGSTIERRAGRGAFEVFKAYQQLIDMMSEDEIREYKKFIVIKLLGDFDYNRKFLKNEYFEEFNQELFNFVKNNLHSILLDNYFSDYKKRLYEKSIEFGVLNSDIKSSNNIDESLELSIIMPCHNVAKYVEKSLSLCLDIKKINFELIAIDDGSSDETLAVLRKYEGRIKNFKIISISSSTGNPGAPRNIGILSSVGGYVAFLDADDWVSVNDFEKFVLSSIGSEVDVGVSSYFFRIENGLEKKIDLYKSNYDIEVSKKFIFGTPYFSNIWNRVYKREFLLKNNIYFPDMYVAEDMLFSIKSILCSKKTVVFNNGYYCYLYNREGSTTSERVGEKGFLILKDCWEIIEYLRGIEYDSSEKEMVLRRIASSLSYTFDRLEDDLKISFKNKVDIFISIFNSIFNADMSIYFRK